MARPEACSIREQLRLRGLRGREVIYVTLIGAVFTVVGIVALLGLVDDLAVRSLRPQTLNLGVLLGSIIVLNGAIAAAVGLVLIRAGHMTWRDLGFARPNVRWVLTSVALGLTLVATIEGIERIFDLIYRAINPGADRT